jgi:hypothetical protein
MNIGDSEDIVVGDMEETTSTIWSEGVYKLNPPGSK